MNCIIVDDEPLAREAMKLLIEESDNLQLIGSFNSAATASDFMEQQGVDLVFLDIQMPGITGIEFARTISKKNVYLIQGATETAINEYLDEESEFIQLVHGKNTFTYAADAGRDYMNVAITYRLRYLGV
jgi:DNA-binding LytR/AlgR family response regulator